MAQRISEQVVQYLTTSEDGFTSQAKITDVPLCIQGQSILGTTIQNATNNAYNSNLTTINGHLIINPSFNTANNSSSIRINKNNNGETFLALGGKASSLSDTENGTNDKTWYIGCTTTDLILAKTEKAFQLRNPSLLLNNDGLTVYKHIKIRSSVGNNVGLSIEGNSNNANNTTSVEYGYFKIGTIGTTSTVGEFCLRLGNGTSSGNANNARGIIRIYSEKNGRATILAKPDSTNSSDTEHYLPDAHGWLVTSGGTNRTAVGDTTLPVYVDSNGVVQTVSANAAIVDLTSTTSVSVYSSAPSIGVNGILPIAQGGTGNDTFTSNRPLYYLLTYDGTTTTRQFLSASTIYINNNSLAINKASITSGYNFEVNGKSKFLDVIEGKITQANVTSQANAIAYYSDTVGTFSSANSLYTNGSTLAINKNNITSGYNFEVNGNSYLNGNLTFNTGKQISRSQTGTYYWYEGRSLALLYNPFKSNYYNPFASIKTSDGSWDIATNTGTNYLNKLLFTYITDTYVTNQSTSTPTAQITFEPEGNIRAARLIGNADTATCLKPEYIYRVNFLNDSVYYASSSIITIATSYGTNKRGFGDQQYQITGSIESKAYLIQVYMRNGTQDLFKYFEAYLDCKGDGTQECSLLKDNAYNFKLRINGFGNSVSYSDRNTLQLVATNYGIDRFYAESDQYLEIRFIPLE